MKHIKISAFLLLSLSLLFVHCSEKSPTIPDSFKLLPQSDISLMLANWHDCSIPASSNKNLQSRGELLWYNPYCQVLINDIWPTIEVTPETIHRVQVLHLYFDPEQNISDAADSWNGIMFYLDEETRDKIVSSDRLEITVKGDKGRLHFDFGEISEDVIPDGKLNSEDLPIYGIRNGVLDNGEDIGLDGMAGSNDFWDINANGIKDDFEPYSNDDWEMQENTGCDDIPKTCRTEGNLQLDTEDLNGNDRLDTLNNYSEYILNLDKSRADTALIIRTLPTNEQKGWFTYSIDLKNPAVIIHSAPAWDTRSVRIWIDGLESASHIEIAAMVLK
ncbi:MAG: hypothetical protein GXO74_04115 [Calditrichaeota bacterium]|nr:hypothetical protein [Calditrichota bacterium]